MTDQPTPRTEAARTLIERYAALGNDLDIFAGILAIEEEAAAQARTEALDGSENRWTRQELLDIFDRTADRPAIRAKIRNLVR